MEDVIAKANREIRTYERVGLHTAQELCAEIERLHGVIERAGKAWLSLEPPVPWEGDVADAMAAGVAKIKQLRGELALLKAENVEQRAEMDDCVLTNEYLLNQRDNLRKSAMALIARLQSSQELILLEAAIVASGD